MLSIRFFVFIAFAVGFCDSAPNPLCRSPRSGMCINIWKCSYYANLLKRRPTPNFVINKIKANYCGFANSTTPKICCPYEQTNEVTENFEKHHNFRLLSEDCGDIAIGTRIVHGASASPREFPWMALIAYTTEDSSEEQDFKCGGTLINSRYVLTAAHCLEDKSVLGVRLGEFDITLEVECYRKHDCEPPVQDILIDKVIIHEGYNLTNHVNDIGLLRLATPAVFAVNVQPICLPVNNLQKVNLLGRFLTVTGWGITETGHKSMVLQKVSIPIVPLRNCKRVYGSFVPMSKSQICAGGYKGRDSCSGDSGGPLQYITWVGQTQKYVQDGIVSYGSKQCGIDGRPAIYTNVKEYITWILDNIEP